MQAEGVGVSPHCSEFLDIQHDEAASPWQAIPISWEAWARQGRVGRSISETSPSQVSFDVTSGVLPCWRPGVDRLQLEPAAW